MIKVNGHAILVDPFVNHKTLTPNTNEISTTGRIKY